MLTKKQQLKQLDNSFEVFTNTYKTFRENFLLTNYQANSKFSYTISAGHGGLDSQGNYLPKSGKQFYHDGMDLHYGSYFYEGVFNRIIANNLCTRLKESRMVYEKLYHPYEDWSLEKKSNMVNNYHVNVKKTILFELHSNASKYHNARGFSVYTSPGHTTSDKIASVLWHYVAEFANDFGITMRKQDYKDGDVDYEAKFWMCTQTVCYSILPECLFFDNVKDVIVLMNPKFQAKYVDALYKTIVWCEENL